MINQFFVCLGSDSRSFKVGDDGPHEVRVTLDVHPVAGIGEPDELGVGEDGPG